MIDLSKAQSFLDDLIDQHADHLDQAQGFGMRTAAYPKGLMPLKDAQRIVASFNKDVDQIVTFLNGLLSAGKPPEGMQTEFEALKAKATKIHKKFADDRKNAQDALEKYEDLLVGEHFQAAFEAIRHAILDLDPADDVDVDFKTKLYLDASPAYASGQIILKKGPVSVTVTMGYRAEDEFYWGEIQSSKRYKAFKDVATKKGHTFLPKFVRDFVGQVKALSDADSTGIFTSRKKVDLQLVDNDAILGDLRPALNAEIQLRWAGGMSSDLKASPPWATPVTLNSSGTEGTGTVDWARSSWFGPVTDSRAARLTEATETKRKSLIRPFEVTTKGGKTWIVTAINTPEWEYRISGSTPTFFKAPEVYSKWPIEWATKPASIDALRARAREVKVQINKDMPKAEIVKVIQDRTRQPSDLFMQVASITFKFTLKKGKLSAQRLATRYLQAGGAGFATYSAGSDVGRAFRDAVQDAAHERGHGGYSGTIAEKPGYQVRKQDPMTRKEALEFADTDMDHNDKWGPAFAVPVSEEKVLKKENVTVTVDAKNEADARRKGTLQIKATGRIPPNATILVTVATVKSLGPKKFEVTGERRASIVGNVTVWLFYGWASN